ncbi:multi-component transcriptional regulator [Nostocales cyanobacterium HT-58-2]|nr:multi-component transcriptional regulator [Nostocales cyanobacterium HT-58-2]
MKILLIEDDEFNALLLVKSLKAYNYQIETAKDGLTGFELAKTFDFDLIVLDVMLPKMDGISLCRQLRQEGYQTPILILTANDSTSLRVTGIEAGADDYLTKPVEILELVARIRALLRRGKVVTPTVISWENLQLDISTTEVSYNGIRLHLTPKEYGLLELFLRNPRKIFSRSALLDSVWSSSESPGEEAVTTQIKGLRQKLKSVGMTEDLIETVYGLGYRLREDKKGDQKQGAQKQNKQRRQTISSTQLSKKRKAEAEVMVLVKKIWEEFKESRLGEQLELLEQVLADLSAGSIDSQLLEQAQTEAHRLAGTLGCYGFHKGSKVAREIEVLLQTISSCKQYTTLQLEKLEELMTSLKQILQQQPSQPAIPPVSRLPTARVLLIDDDMVLAERMKVEAAAWNLQVEVATDLSAAKSRLSLSCPDVILLDLTFPNSQENGLTFLEEITKEKFGIPVIVFTASEQFRYRVEAARLGAYIFLHKSMPIDEVLSVVRKALNQHTATEAKVMVVDDDPVVLNHVKNLLFPWGFQVTTLQHPEHFWKILEATTPELLILDIEMPDFNGIELCQVVRNDSRWSHLPILFLSVHSDEKTVQNVYAVGADDYVRKPIEEQELITRVLNRIDRTQMRRKLPVNN